MFTKAHVLHCSKMKNLHQTATALYTDKKSKKLKKTQLGLRNVNNNKLPIENT